MRGTRLESMVSQRRDSEEDALLNRVPIKLAESSRGW